jgi:hypothetical protein
MIFVFLIIGWIIGLLVGAFFLIQPMIVLFFGLPTTIKMKNQGIINNANRLVLSYLVSLLILGSLFVISVGVIDSFFPSLALGFWIGVVIVFLLGFNKIGKAHNMPEFIEKNMRNIDTSFLFQYIESVKANHPSSKAKNDHVSIVSEYVYADLKKMTKQVVEIQDLRINDAWDDMVTIAMRLYKEELDEHWSETIAALSTEWDLKNKDEHTIQKEIFIALVTLELTSLDSLFEEQAAIIRRNVINYLIDLYGNKEHIETLVNDIYYPAAEHALETFYADERFNSVICKRLKQPVSNEVVMTISKLYAHMMGKWYVIKATMDQANSQDATA